MSETCTVPVLWSIGEACSALCDLAEATGLEERARFNWVLLIARPGYVANDLAIAYWHAVGADLDRTDAVNAKPLKAFSPPAAATAQAVGEQMRRALNAARKAGRRA